MINLNFSQLSDVLNVENQAPGEFLGVSIDTRTLKPGNLYVAIKGDRFDGHSFALDAAKKGAAAVVVEQPIDDCSCPQFVVSDTQLALGQLASFWRSQFNIPVVAITGSNGKTTTKNMVGHILSMHCRALYGVSEKGDSAVLVTQGNLNNYYGLPLTLFQLNASHRFVVLEMGMSHQGEIEYLSNIAKPDIAVITNISGAHMQNFKSLEDIADAKSEISSGLNSEGLLILNRDDSCFNRLFEYAQPVTIKTFSFDHPYAHITAHEPKLYPTKNELDLTLRSGTIQHLDLPLAGKHNVMNALAAALVCVELGVHLKTIAGALQSIQPEKGRLNEHHLANGAIIIDDCYNANPASFKAAVDVLASYSDRRKVIVMGDMKELGEDAGSIHAAIGQYVVDKKIDDLLTIGELAKEANGRHFTSQSDLISFVNGLINKDYVVLIKGSRSMGLEAVVNALTESGN